MLRDYQLTTKLPPPSTARQDLNTRAIVEGKETSTHSLRPRRRFKRKATKFKKQLILVIESVFFAYFALQRSGQCVDGALSDSRRQLEGAARINYVGTCCM